MQHLCAPKAHTHVEPVCTQGSHSTTCLPVQAPADEVAAYQAVMDARKAEAQASAAAAASDPASALPAGIKVEEPFSLAQPGKKDGETKVVREVDGAIMAYCWSVADSTWQQIGEVVPAPSGGTKVSGCGAVVECAHVCVADMVGCSTARSWVSLLAQGVLDWITHNALFQHTAVSDHDPESTADGVCNQIGLA